MTHQEYLAYKANAEDPPTDFQEQTMIEHIVGSCREGDCLSERKRILSLTDESE